MSDAELGALILGGCERLLLTVTAGPRLNRRIAAHCKVSLEEIEHLRDTRNKFAHSGKAARPDLERALATIRRAEINLGVSHVVANVNPYGGTGGARHTATWSSSMRLGVALDALAEHWLAVSVTVISIISIVAIVILVSNVGIVGLIVAPLVIIGALIVLRVVCWIVAVGSFLYAIALLVQEDVLKGLLFLGLSGIAGAIGGFTGD